MTGACKASSQVVNDYLRLFVNQNCGSCEVL